MKKLLFGIFAAATMLFTSCSQDEFDMPVTGDMTTVSFSLETPVMGSRAYGDGMTATNLKYAVFDLTDNTRTYLVDLSSEDGDEFNGKSTLVPFQLATGHTYGFIFWAGNEEAPYNLDLEHGTLSINYEGITANNETLDAFYAYKEHTVKGAETIKVDLYRPFTQINFGTNDFEASAKAGYTPVQTQVVVSEAYTGLDLFTGEVDGSVTDVTFTYSDIPEGETFPKAGGYDYLAMAYVLVPAEQTLVNTTLYHKDEKENEYSLNVSNVPVQRNYRTNLYGSLLTDALNVEVEKQPEYGDNENDIDIDAAICSRDENNKVVCEKPALPIGVTTESFAANKNAGVVAINAQGEAVYFPTTSKGLLDAMNASKTGEIYLAPNSTITVKAHEAQIPATGIKIYGNGATITGGEYDFSINEIDVEKDGTVDIYIENLNNARIWGDATVECTINVTLNNCTFLGEGFNTNTYSRGFIMMRDKGISTHNITIKDCYCEGVQTAVHSTSDGKFIIKNSTFKEVGIPVNFAKKNTREATVLVEGCEFIKCGLKEHGEDTAWDYAAPIRVVDNGGPDNSMFVKISNCSITERLGSYDVLLTEYRTDKERSAYYVAREIENSGELEVRDWR